MDLQEEIDAVRSKVQVEGFVRWVGTDRARFGQLMEFFLGEEAPLADKSAWIAGHCAERHAELVSPWLRPLIKKLQRSDTTDAVKRNSVRMLQFVDLPKKIQGAVANICFTLLSSIDEPIAVRVFAMTVLANIARTAPELRKELETVVRQMLPSGTPAFRARARHVLKNLAISERAADPDEDQGLEQWLQKRS